MFILYPTGPVGSDCTAPYSIDLDKDYTVKEFIDAVLSRRKEEWGCIYIVDNIDKLNALSCDYKHGWLKSNLPENVLDKKVVSASAHGGWTLMEYELRIKN